MTFTKESGNNGKIPPIPSGDSTLNELLEGGFHKDLVYVLYGDKMTITKILLTTSVISQKAYAHGGLDNNTKIAFIDGINRFDPYYVSKFAVSQNLSPRIVLENILIIRAFTVEQMIEVLEHKLSDLKEVKVVLISGITTLLQNYITLPFKALLKTIESIKGAFQKIKSLIIITAPFINEYSKILQPLNSKKVLSYFGNVLVLIKDEERYIEYILVQHPFLPEKRLLKQKPKVKTEINQKNFKSLDFWFSNQKDD